MKKNSPLTADTPEDLARILGLGDSDAQEWRVQHALFEQLTKAVASSDLTHAEVARRAGSSRSRVTAILNGNLDKVSTDLLVRLLGAIGYRVEVSVSRMEPAA
jgi:predicted XRE-type DNA-binding protein